MSQSCTKQTKAKFGGEKPKDKEKLADYTAALDKCRRDRNNKIIEKTEEAVLQALWKVIKVVLLKKIGA